jgi:thymidylate synthase (FAD)
MSDTAIDIISKTEKYIDVIWLAGRTCYSSSAVAEVSRRDKVLFVRRLIAAGHLSPIEHAVITVSILNMTRSLMAQLTRHRLCSYSFRSTHYSNYSGFMFNHIKTGQQEIDDRYESLVNDINRLYTDMLAAGIKKELAREIIPNSAYTNAVITANVREWRLIIQTRIGKENTCDMSRFARTLLRTLYLGMPEIFDDLVDKYEVDKYAI